MKRKKDFFMNDTARIPFSVLGVFLILGSSMTTVFIARLELQKSEEYVSTMDLNEIELLLEQAETDMQTALNHVGMNAFKALGKQPVIQTSLGSPEAINLLRVRGIIQEELNIYLTAHYSESTCTNGHYALNLVLTNNTPIPFKESIVLTKVDMNMRRITIPFLGPAEQRNHTTYWVAAVPFVVEIYDITTEEPRKVLEQSITISTLITSRYPYLESIVNEYQQTINGAFSPLWMFTTGCSNIYAMVRGYKHYTAGQPFNVVDNRHLALIINGGLLLEQSLVMSSVDPLAIINLVMNTKKTLQQPQGDLLSTLNIDLNDEHGYALNTNDLSQGSANVDAGDDLNTSIDTCPHLNLSDIAEQILYHITGVTLRFENHAGDHVEEEILFDEDAQQHIQEKVQYWMNHSYYLTSVVKQYTINETTQHTIEELITNIYQDQIYTKVMHRDTLEEIPGNPGEGWTDGGAGAWNAEGLIPHSKMIIKPPRGMVQPGSSLFEEQYFVSFERLHCWWRMEWHNISGNLTLMKVWNNVTDVRTEMVFLHTILSEYAVNNETSNDVYDVLYFNESVNDLNLEDTLETYLLQYPDSNIEKQTLLLTQGNTGETGLYSRVNGVFAPEIIDEAWESLNDILTQIGSITVDPTINTTTSPDPFSLLELVKNDLLNHYRVHIQDYEAFSAYHPDSAFSSVGNKAVYSIRAWYVDSVDTAIENIFSTIAEQVETTIDDLLPPDADFASHDISTTLENTADGLQNQLTIPFGWDTTLLRLDETETNRWNETVRLAVDQTPDYLNPFETITEDGEELWTLKIRNRCVFGPTGLPLLPPTPVTPWIVTINTWLIDVEGEFLRMKLLDASDETIFNPLIGHEPQSYVREARVISVGDITLGENTRVRFGFTTLAFALVPPWGMMVGDVQDNWYDDHTPGFDEER